MTDYDLLQDVAGGAHVREARDKQPGDAASDRTQAEVSRALEHGRPDALSAAGAAHVQRLAGNAAMSSLVAQREESTDAVHDVINSGGGSTLDENTRTTMESQLGTDLGDVRIHSGSTAAAAAKSVQAEAFTVGNNIVMGEGRSSSDTRTLAHELTHVVQQREGPVPGDSIGNGLKVSDPGDWAERQAEATADRVVTGDDAGHDHGATAAVQTSAVQRDTGDDEGLQAEAIQRQEEDELQEEPIQRQEEDELQEEPIQRQEAPAEEEEMETT